MPGPWAVWRRVRVTGVVLVGAFAVLTAHEVWATRDEPGGRRLMHLVT